MSGWGRGRGCQSGCERRSDTFLKKKLWGGGGGCLVGGQGGCDRRSEVFVKIQKKNWGGGGVGPGGGSDQGLGRGGGSKVWGRWVMWDMGDVNKE